MRRGSLPEVRPGAQLILHHRSEFQRVVVTRYRHDIRLFIDGMLQFSSLDEHRYHEALVHPVIQAAGGTACARVLVLGGGDGLALREILKHRTVAEVVVVDLDPAVTSLFRAGDGGSEELVRLNAGAFGDARVRLHSGDAAAYIRSYRGEPWDAIILDLPDPATETLAALYTRDMFSEALRRLRADTGALITQAASPFTHGAAFWCIVHTLQAARPTGHVLPLSVAVPSFGIWGFALWTAEKHDLAAAEALPAGVRTHFLSPRALRGLAILGADEQVLSAGAAAGAAEDHELAARVLNEEHELVLHDMFRAGNFEHGNDF
eukprot:g3141.t1